MTHRLDRRIAILRGKRQGSFDTDQYYLEKAKRARLARKARSLLRRMQPIALVTPRWTQAERFLDDLSTDLLLGEPSVVSRTLSLAPLEGRTPHQAWAWLVQAMTEFCQFELEGPAWRVVSRRGFRHVMAELFTRAEHGQRRCLMIHGLEHIHVEALRDLIQVFEDHVHNRTERPRFNLLLAGSIEAPHFEFVGVERLVLPDFSQAEAVEVLVEHLGPQTPGYLRELVHLVGGVPAILDTLGGEPTSRLSEVMANQEAIWRVLGHLALEIRSSLEIVALDSKLSTRLENIAKNGPIPTDPTQDFALLRTGLVSQDTTQREQVKMRSPVFAQLALSA